MSEALEKINSKQLSIRKASTVYGIPRITLSNAKNTWLEKEKKKQSEELEENRRKRIELKEQKAAARKHS